MSVAGPGADAGAAINNPPLTCTAGTGAPVIYNLTGSGNFYALNTGTRANTPAAPSTLAPSRSEENALGINQSGTVAYSMDQTVSGGTSTLAVTTISSGAASDFTVPSSGGGIVAGGFDPANGEFYYGGWNTADTTFTLYAFNGTTGSEVGTITPGGTYGSGDLTFDGSGDVYVLGGASGAGTGKIFEVVAPVPTSGTGALTAKTIATLSGSGNFDGIAFGANSLLYAEDSGGDLYSISPGGTITTLGAQTGLSGTPTDLASCSYNGTLELQKNIAGPSGPNDQFQLAITGGGLSTGNTGVTSGSTTGLQTASSEIAGPVVALPSSVYTITETAASTTPATNLANYSASYNCVNGSASFGSGPLTLASGAFSATLPAFPQPSGASGAMVVCTITNTPMSSSLTVMKSASPTTYSASGQTIGYSFLVTNNGNVTMNNIAINDGLAGITGLNCPNASLAVGAFETCTGSYSTSQADVDNGSVTNTATAQGTAPGTSTVTKSPPSTATISATQSAAITLSKTVNGVKGPIAITGPTTLNYAFRATNSGNVTLTGVNITDTPFSGLSALSCGSATNGSITLAPGASATCTATYAVNQAAIDAGTSIVDTGTVTGATPASDTSQPTVSNTSNTVTVNITQSPSLKVVKSASVSSVSAAGQTYTYTFAVTNNGNVTESNIGIADTQSTPSLAANLGPITCPQSSLAPGGAESCTALYTVSQADMDAGSIGDTAQATGTAPNGSTTKSPGYGAVVTTVQSPSLSLTKSASVTQVSQVGQQVTYTFAVKNTGNVSVNAIAIADTQSAPSVAANLSPITCPQPTLAPGAAENCTATYAVTQVDLNHGTITDTATASGKTTIGTTVKSNPSSVTIQAVQTIMSGRAFDIGLDVGATGIALVGPVTVNDTGGVETAAATTTPTPCVAAAAVKDLAITGDVCAGVTTTTNPGVSTATSSIANVAVGVAGIPAIDLQAVQSTSTTSCAGSSGSVTIAYLSVGGVVVISKPTVIAPNTGLSLGVVSLVLNQQTPFNIGGDKGLTVNAVHVQVDALGLAGVNLVVGSSTSDIECAVPTQAPVLTGEANDVDLLGAALGTTVGANVVVNDTSPVITNQASTTTPACAASAAVVDLTLTGNVCAPVTTKPTVGTTPASSTATASVANLVTGLGIPVITLKAVQSTSTTSCTASSGSVTIAYLQIGTTVVIAKPTTILPNMRVVVGPVTLILNQQIPFNGADTGLIVNAVAISVTTGGVLTALGTIASSTSDILDC